MDASSPRWQAITDSEFPWEREALAFVRDRLPDHEPYRAWANFEFIADDGSINEVDLLVLTSKGFYLVEIKSWPGIVEGDQGTWTWRHGGRVRTVDNPLLLANRKAKKLISLLRRQPALHRKALPARFSKHTSSCPMKTSTAGSRTTSAQACTFVTLAAVATSGPASSLR